jgi:hypothetical protein
MTLVVAEAFSPFSRTYEYETGHTSLKFILSRFPFPSRSIRKLSLNGDWFGLLHFALLDVTMRLLRPVHITRARATAYTHYE